MSVKNIVFTLTLMLIGAIHSAFAQSEEGISITVTVPVQSTEGKVIFGLHNESTFMKAPLAGQVSQIVDGKAIVTFEGVTPGTYAVMCFHDRNNDDQMNFQANGMPLEDYGVSNNNMSMGPPTWADAKFEVAKENLELEIRM
ncbi:DUF2141 domain-containing protein [Gilvibacter sp.]|uniref:DUF2141 domain-containing protein n=1 Tax=Gilvibacter sp. TaxID=2729997 RepID=UPI003F4A0119